GGRSRAGAGRGRPAPSPGGGHLATSSAAMNGYVAGGYGVTTVILIAYAWRTIRRGRALAKSDPDEERTWR
ncbi:MAG: hypothetical protein M3137_04090, partial [Actinomycetota bacterium]|nr:hypothetical protein [Actinomycetota bacterium]